jgi:hypothetical protein
MKFRKIEILEKDTNKKGDLFGRLMADLFHTLGYNEPRLNIHKSGREIDLNSFHRTENKIAIAECKAHSDSIGGSDINKFIGVLDAEKTKMKKDKRYKGLSVVGYFISLSGFKETAIEQENDLDNNRLVLVKPEKIIDELIQGRVLVSIEKAISSLSSFSSNLSLIQYVDLLAYEKGWIWSFYFSDSEGQKPSHFALVHAEGRPLVRDLSDEIFKLDKKSNNILKDLILLNVPDKTALLNKALTETKKKYFKYLENELGEIQFEGLPTDKEAGSVKVNLESIFVPLHFIQSKYRTKKDEFESEEIVREGIGDILKKKTKIAILAKPGGGKTTLIKRIAIAYAFPERRKQINDELPDKNWFPIFLRCREIGDKVTQSITDIINNVPSRAEIHSCSDSFSTLVSDSLQNGDALLLIDGLDEIAEDKHRIAFVNQLRTFIATFPTINIIVTSREAGFRVVAGSLATYCENYSLSNLIESEIIELCLKWHKAIIDNSENTIKEANKLSELILKDSRIKVLAENPLLLTTLLFVKRWAGYLPTKRSVLYQEMIKLLLVTWNVEGHEILEIEEAEPQLAFVAYWMTLNGQQTITSEDLNLCLIEARQQMPEILGYTKVSPHEFIKRVESRSSLLILSGHKRLNSGQVTAMYEFLHLSFQEYLTAKAIVKKYLPISEANKTAVDLIKPNINNDIWKEVIPLAAVLLERETKDLIEYLIQETKMVPTRESIEKKKHNFLAPSLLGSCLANEIQINPDLLAIAIEWYAKKSTSHQDKSSTEIVLKNKFGATFRKRVIDCFFEKYDDKYSFPLGAHIAEFSYTDIIQNDKNISINSEIFSLLNDTNKEKKCTGILILMEYAFRSSLPTDIKNGTILNNITIFKIALKQLKSNDSHFRFSISWFIAWTGESNLLPESVRIPFVIELTKLWITVVEYNLRRAISWALVKILVPNIPLSKFSKMKMLQKTVVEIYKKPKTEFDKLISIYLGTIIGEQFDKQEIEEEFKRNSHMLGSSDVQLSSFAKFAKVLGISLKKDSITKK